MCTLYGGSKNSSCGARRGKHFTLRAKADKKIKSYINKKIARIALVYLLGTHPGTLL
jgi:hypothetical protein